MKLQFINQWSESEPGSRDIIWFGIETSSFRYIPRDGTFNIHAFIGGLGLVWWM